MTTINVDSIIETTAESETIAGLLGEVAQTAPDRAVRILLDHLYMEEVRAESAAESTARDYDKGVVEDDDEAHEQRGAAQVYGEVAVYLRGLLAGLTRTAEDRKDQ